MTAAATRWRLAALASLAGAHLVVSLLAVVPGYLSIDEATYHLMAKNQAERGDLELWNGYRELPSPELVAASIVARDGRLVGRPPVLYPALAAPFYRLWGYRGLFALNALAFAGVVGLTYVLARKLFDDRNLALDGCLVLVAASFAWEYSQAAWTHATALAFNLAAMTLAVSAVLEPRRGRWLALGAGLVAGLGVGVRLDMVFVLACVLAIFVYRSPSQPGRALAAAGGALPAMAAWSMINHSRFGTWSPLSMGRGAGLPEVERYLPFLALAAATAGAAWLLTRQPARRWLASHWLGRRRRLAWAAVVLAAVVALGVAPVRRLALQQARGLYTLGVDLRALDGDRREPAMRRGADGAVIYAGGVKKALLQSCPYLVLLLLLVRRRDGHRRDSGRLVLALVVPVAFLGFYAQFSWHGGLALNLRYLTALLPYAAILTAYSLRQLALLSGGRISTAAAAIGTGLALLAYLAAGAGGESLRLLTLPLVLAGALLAALLLTTRRGGVGGARAAAALTAAALTWAALAAFAYDYPRARALRRFNLETGQRVSKLVPPDSLFFADFVDPFFLLVERGRVRIARPALDGYRDMPRLTDFHLGAGRRVYGAFDRRRWEILGRGPLTAFERETVWDAGAFVLAEITRDGRKIDTPAGGH